MLAKNRKPGKNAPRGVIVAWLKRNWKLEMWGLIDCDRCQQRTNTYPCDACKRWDHAVENHRRNWTE